MLIEHQVLLEENVAFKSKIITLKQKDLKLNQHLQNFKFKGDHIKC